MAAFFTPRALLLQLWGREMGGTYIMDLGTLAEF